MTTDVEQLRVGVHVLDLEPSLADRRFDFSAGYVRDFGGVEGAFAEADVAPYVQSTNDRVFRTWVGVQPRVLLADAPDALDGNAMEAGVGVALRGSAEWSWDLGSGRGFAGEAAVGPYAEVAYGEVGPLAVTTLAAGISVHLPMIAGIIPLGRRPCCCR